jgi:hypothetical protein
MSAATIDLAFQGIAQKAREACVDRRGDCRVLRIALLYGEEFRLPRASRWLQVLSGTAWVSIRGRDYVLDGGDCLAIGKAKEGAIVSSLREEGIVFEIS